VLSDRKAKVYDTYGQAGLSSRPCDGFYGRFFRIFHDILVFFGFEDIYWRSASRRHAQPARL